MSVAHAVHSGLGGLLQAADQLLDLLGGLTGTLCQGTYFIGYHSEAAAHVAGSGCLDGCIQGQQVGLFGDAADDFDHPADFTAILGHSGYRVTAATDQSGQLLDGCTGTVGHLLALAAQLARLLAGLCSLLHMLRDFACGGSHLLYGSGYLFAFQALLMQAVGAVLCQFLGLGGLLVEVHGAFLQACKAGAQVSALAVHGHFQACFGAAAVGVHAGRQGVAAGVFGMT